MGFVPSLGRWLGVMKPCDPTDRQTDRLGTLFLSSLPPLSNLPTTAAEQRHTQHTGGDLKETTTTRPSVCVCVYVQQSTASS